MRRIGCGLEMGADDYVTKPFSPREFNCESESAFAARGTAHGFAAHY